MSTNYIDWSDEFSIGITHVDQQHQVLVSMLNSLYKAMEIGDTRETITDVILELIMYTDTHFATEDRLMVKHDYPEIEEHRAQHNELTEKVRKYRARFEAGEQLEDELFQFLVKWLINHIKGTDKKVGAFMKENDIVIV